MRIRRVVRVAGYVAASRAGSLRHRARRSIAPQRWTRHDPNRILWVAPVDVVATTAERIPEDLRGRVIGGDWDVTSVPLDELAVWRGLEQRLRQGRAWADTDLAPERYRPGAPNAGRRPHELTPAALLERYGRLDALAASLLRDGWVAHHDVGAPFVREMAVAIGRDGRLIRNSGGLHRLVMAHLLGLERIPCRVLVEHTALDESR